ncbi:MAG: hypothetical protein Q8M09_11695 [Pseudomonadota bacterium]|nr:hypothetical protein [Pseudomonadota bacterium]MDP1904892.1 hypothetical protein [Pseudomonadota bacterium]MDP2353421.1 hypothetical protein [Pseudomonadota bacterium]
MTMNQSGALIVFCALLLGARADAAQTEPPRQVKNPAAVQPLRAKPAEKPQATSNRDRVSVTGYGQDPGEETQEMRPNPVNSKPARRPDPARAPAGEPRPALGR